MLSMSPCNIVCTCGVQHSPPHNNRSHLLHTTHTSAQTHWHIQVHGTWTQVRTHTQWCTTSEYKYTTTTHLPTHPYTHTHTQHRQTNTHRHSTHTIAHGTRKVQMRTMASQHTPPPWTSSPTVVGLNTVHIKVHTYVHLHTPGLPCACTDTGCALFDTQVASHWSKNQYHIISLCNLPYSNSTVLFVMFCEDSQGTHFNYSMHCDVIPWCLLHALCSSHESPHQCTRVYHTLNAQTMYSKLRNLNQISPPTSPLLFLLHSLIKHSYLIHVNL